MKSMLVHVDILWKLKDAAVSALTSCVILKAHVSVAGIP
jgi:hypothetical protein